MTAKRSRARIIFSLTDPLPTQYTTSKLVIVHPTDHFEERRRKIDDIFRTRVQQKPLYDEDTRKLHETADKFRESADKALDRGEVQQHWENTTHAAQCYAEVALRAGKRLEEILSEIEKPVRMPIHRSRENLTVVVLSALNPGLRQLQATREITTEGNQEWGVYEDLIKHYLEGGKTPLPNEEVLKARSLVEATIRVKRQMESTTQTPHLFSVEETEKIRKAITPEAARNLMTRIEQNPTTPRLQVTMTMVAHGLTHQQTK